MRLLHALDQKARPPFQVLVIQDESRLGRETIETAFVLKQIVQAGVRVFFYLDDRERTLDAPIDKVMLAVTDPSNEAPTPRAPGWTGESGRGLQIVGALSYVWGWSPLEGRGKAVWAVLRCS